MTSTTPPATQTIKVRIEDVDLTNLVGHAIDKTNSRIQVSFRDIPGGGVYRIPNQGEIWLAERRGYIWHLKSRLHIPDQQNNIESFVNPGDLLLETSGTVYLNGRAAGAWINQVFTSVSAFTSITLSSKPANPAAIQVFVNGLLVPPTGWTIADKVITFGLSMSSGTIVVYYETLDNAVYYETADSSP